MKKFKLDKNFNKKMVILALVGTLAFTSLTACSSKTTPDGKSDGKVLYNSKVITFDNGHKDIVKIIEGCNSEKYNHYKSIITDEKYVSQECQENSSILSIQKYVKYNIVDEQSIIEYLTTDEIVKFYEGKITEEDISQIIKRIFTNQDSNQKTK